MKHKVKVDGPYKHDVVITNVLVTPEETTPISLFTSRTEKGKREYVIWQYLLLGPERFDDGTTAAPSQSLMLVARMLMKAGTTMWITSDSPVTIKHSVERP